MPEGRHFGLRSRRSKVRILPGALVASWIRDRREDRAMCCYSCCYCKAGSGPCLVRWKGESRRRAHRKGPRKMRSKRSARSRGSQAALRRRQFRRGSTTCASQPANKTCSLHLQRAAVSLVRSTFVAFACPGLQTLNRRPGLTRDAVRVQQEIRRSCPSPCVRLECLQKSGRQFLKACEA
jgi:hypothetical protein